MKFTKMQGIGNDYVYVDCTREMIPHPAKTAIRVSERHFGIGSDGLILIAASEVADFKMIMYNLDGSKAQMCGNGIRCVGKFVYDKGLTDKTEITVETGAGIKTLKLNVRDNKVKTVTVDMGEPVLEPQKIPVASREKTALDVPMTVLGKEYRVNCVSMGNPHAVIFFPGSTDLISIDLPKIGPHFEHDPFFPQRTNTEFAKIIDSKTIAMRVWERGTGETLACGTGACATLVAASLRGLTGRSAQLRLLGGSLKIKWDEKDNHVYMTGPAEISFEGEIEL